MISLVITLAADELPLAELLLQHLGAVSTSIAEPKDCVDPIYEPPIDSHPLWHQATLIAHFEGPQSIELISNSLQNLLQHEVTIQLEELFEKDWQAAYQQHYQPQIIDQKLCVSAPWHELKQSYPIHFRINPGIAFGTGTHPTTRLCLQWLVHHHAERDTVLDLGCGSGILSLCAYALGCRCITAVDIDRQAISATKANIGLNDYSADAFQVQTNAPKAGQQFDLILANILFTPLIEFREQFHQWLNPKDGQLVVSGILSSQIDRLIEHYSEHFYCENKFIQDEWALLQFAPVR